MGIFTSFLEPIITRLYIRIDYATRVPNKMDGLNIKMRKNPKVFWNGKFLIGHTSSFRMGQLLRFNLKVPRQKKGQDDYEYMCVTFVNAMRKAFKDGGYMTIDKNVEWGGTFLVVYKKVIYEVCESLQVQMTSEDFDSCGCGVFYAKGSLYSTKGRKAFYRVVEALNSAVHFSGGVRPPFSIGSTKNKKITIIG